MSWQILSCGSPKPAAFSTISRSLGVETGNVLLSRSGNLCSFRSPPLPIRLLRWLCAQRIEIDGFRIYVLHILAELAPQAADKVDAVQSYSANCFGIDDQKWYVRPLPVSSRAGTRPELRLPNPAAQTRIVSVASFGWIPANLCDLSKG
jgi:hypothetical protein